ncbi:hypothetical protein ACPV5U_24350 [Vibrio mediterranei]|jgi:hypothetical protein
MPKLSKATIKRQKGLTAVEALFGVILLTAFGIAAMQALQRLSYETTAEVALKRIINISDVMQRAYIDSITRGTAPNDITSYPQDVAALIAQSRIPNCSVAQEFAGQCIHEAKLPWVTTTNADQMMTITRFIDPVDNFPAFRISFSLAGIPSITQRNVIRNRISTLPNYTENAANTVTITYSRPGSAVSLENLVARDGSTPMTADWDYGGFDLNNIRHINDVNDMSFEGVNDRTALTGSIKIGSARIDSNGGISVDKPSCPTTPIAYTPQIQVWTVALSTSNLVYNVKGFAAWEVDQGSTWQIFFRSIAEDNNGNQGYFYEGVVAYATWCDFA